MNKVKILTHKECGQCGRVRDHETEYSEETWDKLTRYNPMDNYTDSEGVRHHHIFDVCQACI